MLNLFGEKRVALVVGNGDYHADVGKLFNPKKDADAIAKSLAGCGFKVTNRFDLSWPDMKGECEQFVQDSVGADVSLFFYSGHGAQFDGENYLLPVDFEISDSEIREHSIDLTSFLGQVSTASNTCLAFLDACRDNPNVVRSIAQHAVLAASNAKKIEFDEGNKPSQKTPKVVAGLARFDLPAGDRNTFIAFATAPGQVAYDGTGQNSPYTNALLNYLGIPGLSLDTLMQRVTRDVKKVTNERQVPWVNSTVEKPFYFKKLLWTPLMIFLALGLLVGPMAVLLGMIGLQVMIPWGGQLGNNMSTESFVFPWAAAFGVGASTGMLVAFGSWLSGQQRSLMTVIAIVIAASFASQYVHIKVLNWQSPVIVDQFKKDRLAELLDGDNLADISEEKKKQVEEQINQEVASSKLVSGSVSKLASGTPFLVLFPLVIFLFLSHVMPALQRFWLFIPCVVFSLLLAAMEPAMLKSFLPAGLNQPGEVSLLGLWLSGAVSLFVVSIGFSTYTADIVARPSIFRLNAPVTRQYLWPMVLAAISGFAGALFYPAHAYFGGLIQEFFGVQLVPAVFFGIALAVITHTSLKANGYVSGLILINSILAWIIMYPIARSAWPIFPTMTGAIGYAIIMTLAFTMLIKELQWPVFWALAIATGVIGALPYEFNLMDNFLPTEQLSSEFGTFVSSSSLFVVWEVLWVAVVIYCGAEAKRSFQGAWTKER